MAGLIDRAVKKLRRDGVLSLGRRAVSFTYNTGIWPYLPPRELEYNGVTVLAGRWFDTLVPWRVPHHPHPEQYELGLCTAIRTYIEQGDTVVIVGGGWGVSTVVAARQVGESGEVITYEGSQTNTNRVLDTVNRNGVDDRTRIMNAVVSEALEVGSGDLGDTIAPTELPEMDALVLDCEGAELSILTDLEELPPLVIVETHGRLGAPEDEIRAVLEQQGYTFDYRAIAETGQLEQMMRENGVFVLAAVRSEE